MSPLVKRPRPLAILAALAVCAAALGVGYLLLAYLLFDLFGESWLNRKPERFVIGWRSAKMVAPGEFEVKGLTLRGRTQQVLWSATLEDARLRLNLVELLAREIHFESADGRGLHFQLRRLKADALGFEGLPPIAAFAGELLVPAPSGRPRWALTIDSFTFTEVRELWIDQTRYQAESLEGRMTGALELRMRQSVELPALAAELPAGKLTLKNDRLAQIDLLKVRGTLEPTLNRRPQVDLLRNLRLEIDAEASRGDIGVFQHHLRGAPIELNGEGRLAAHIVLADGDLAPGTRLDLAGGNLELRYFGYHGRGRGHAELLVEKAVDGLRESRLEAVLDDFEVGLDGDTEPHLKGQGLRLLAQSADFEVNGRRLPTLLASVELPKTAIPDLAVYNRFLPPRLPFAVRGGRGQVSARFEVDTAKNLGTGRIDLETQGFRADLEGSTLEGKLRLATRLRTPGSQEPQADDRRDPSRDHGPARQLVAADQRLVGAGRYRQWSGRAGATAYDRGRNRRGAARQRTDFCAGAQRKAGGSAGSKVL